MSLEPFCFNLKLAKDSGSGLCNQFYALVGCMEYCLSNNNNNNNIHTIIVVDGLLKEIGTNVYGSLNDVLDLKAINTFLEPFHILIVDASSISLKIVQVLLDNKECNHLINVFSPFIKGLADNTKEMLIPDNIWFHSMTDTTIGYSGKIELTIELNPFTFYKVSLEIVGGHLLKPFHLDLSNNTFNQSPQLFFGQSKNIVLFANLLKHLSFQPCIEEIVDKYYPFSPTVKSNIIHLRVEKDAVDHFCQQWKELNPVIIKTMIENKYIDCIFKYFSKEIPILILSGETDNRVTLFLKENGYTFAFMPKLFQYREINAVIDLSTFKHCSNIFLGVYESSFSYTFMYKWFHYMNNTTNNRAKAIIFKILDEELNEKIFTPLSSISQIQGFE